MASAALCRKGFEEAVNSGSLIGHPVESVKVALTDGAAHAVDSSELAFKLACVYAFREAYKQASPVIMDPIMAVEVGRVNWRHSHCRHQPTLLFLAPSWLGRGLGCCSTCFCLPAGQPIMAVEHITAVKNTGEALFCPGSSWPGHRLHAVCQCCSRLHSTS